jgi:erythromycin esterase-like protein
MRTNKIPLLLFLGWFFLACKTQQRQGTLKNQNTASPLVSYMIEKEQDLDVLLKEIGEARIVLLGESSHGTAEYYNWRAAISKRLISEKGFRLIAVEGDHIDLHRVNEFIKRENRDSGLLRLLLNFNRWPQWLWANMEFSAFIHWVKKYNQSIPAAKGINFYGLDVFNFSSALNELSIVLHDTVGLRQVKSAQDCFSPYGNDALNYSTAVSKPYADCKTQAYNLWQWVQKAIGEKISSERDLLILQHASVVLNGEQYFRTRNRDQAASWNARVWHMQQTIRRLLNFYGRGSKIIVWAHNTHAGDAHYTDMPTRQRTNIGELLRKEYGEKNVFIMGFGSYTGEIIGGYTWGASFSKIKIRPAKEGSWEYLLHHNGANNKIVFSKDIFKQPGFNKWIEQRAIGVVYSETYIPSIIPRRYDAFIYFDSTHAVTPIKK